MKKTSSYLVSLLILFLIFSLLSCASKKNLYYFQGDETILNEVYKYTPTLKPDDMLIITVSALDLESTLPFNQQSPYNTNASGSESITSTNPRLKTYLSQNDVIYVHPNGAKTNSSAYSATTSVFISLAGIIISVISVLTR